MNFNFYKKNFSIGKLFLITILFLLNCSKGPDDVYVEMWKKICKEKSMHPMIEYTAPESITLVSMVVGMSQDEKKSPKFKENIENSCKKEDLYKVSNVVVNGDIATFNDSEGKEIKMRKIDGNWKFVLDKPKK